MNQPRWQILVLFVWILAGTACGVPSNARSVVLPDQKAEKSASREENDSQAEVAFAYSNASGNLLLTLPNTKAASNRSFARAVCGGGYAVDVKFDAEQKAGPRFTGHQRADNFDQDQGLRFAVLNGSVPDESCLLTSRRYLEAREILPIRQGNKPCGPELLAKTPRIARREIILCRSVASFSGDALFLAVEYAPEGENLLAAFVVLLGSDAYVQVLPAKRGNDAWRADDNGEFQPEYVTALFAFRKSDGVFEVVVRWLGAEGDALRLLRTESPGVLETVTEAARYTGPS